MRTFGILVAAGSGQRIGFRKQYAELAGLPMWERAGNALLAGGVEHIWLVVPPEDVGKVRADVQARGRHQHFSVAAGGATRHESVRQGLAALVAAWSGNPGRVDTARPASFAAVGRAAGADDVLVAVHDAARPFVLAADVEAVVAAARRCGAAVLGRPCADTIKRVVAGAVVETIPRDDLWQAETPQVFRLSWLCAAHDAVAAAYTGREELTDDASVVERVLGHPVQVVRSQGWNMKITTPADWECAQALASARWGGEPGCSESGSDLTYIGSPPGASCSSEG
ncbi:MAG: 2-C-methyl-D-erythritol 4-phosphate cytidylyltransferase [Alicyclobacillaceae bacterium]|nr:2-C-methyl-D-erythritol 4-phosphate cytidylyltransferase [Alicyclobacillaceae bacterium]